MKRGAALAGGLVPLVVVLFVPPPAGLSPAAWAAAGLGALMALWWLTEAVPLAATALCHDIHIGIHVLILQARHERPVDAVSDSGQLQVSSFFVGTYQAATDDGKQTTFVISKIPNSQLEVNPHRIINRFSQDVGDGPVGTVANVLFE